jgi:outer membrane protein OmpA-like peptidoglycan-associated protein
VVRLRPFITRRGCKEIQSCFVTPKLFELLGRVAGLGGIALGVLLVVFRDVVRKNVFPKLTNEQAYRTLNLILVLTFAMATLGLAAWVYVAENPRAMVTENPKTTEDRSNQKEALAQLNEMLRPIYLSRFAPRDLPAEERAVLQGHAKRLKDAEASKIVVEGHVDEESPNVNLPISRIMAETVAEYLEHEGIPASSIEIIGYGAERPMKPGRSRYNTRVEIRVVALKP